MSVLAKWYDEARHAVRYFFLRRLPTCQSLAPVMSASLERPLTLRERLVLRVHLAVCVWCEWYLRQLRQLRKASLARGEREPDAADDAAPGMPDDARERIRRALEPKA